MNALHCGLSLPRHLVISRPWWRILREFHDRIGSDLKWIVARFLDAERRELDSSDTDTPNRVDSASYHPQICGMSLPRAYLSKKLTQPLPIKAGGVPRTIRCAADHILAMPQQHVEGCNRWRCAAQLLLDQADIAAVSRQVHLALFYDAQLDIGAMHPARSNKRGSP